jgi:hypothetical protein
MTVMWTAIFRKFFLTFTLGRKMPTYILTHWVNLQDLTRNRSISNFPFFPEGKRYEFLIPSNLYLYYFLLKISIEIMEWKWLVCIFFRNNLLLLTTLRTDNVVWSYKSDFTTLGSIVTKMTKTFSSIDWVLLVFKKIWKAGPTMRWFFTAEIVGQQIFSLLVTLFLLIRECANNRTPFM